MAEQLPSIPDQTLRNMGLIAMFAGVLVVWLVKG